MRQVDNKLNMADLLKAGQEARDRIRNWPKHEQQTARIILEAAGSPESVAALKKIRVNKFR